MVELNKMMDTDVIGTEVEKVIGADVMGTEVEKAIGAEAIGAEVEKVVGAVRKKEVDILFDPGGVRAVVSMTETFKSKSRGAAMEACLASLHTTPDYSFPFSLDSKKQHQDSFKAAPSSGELVDLRRSLKSRALGYSTSSKASRWSYTAAHECIRLCSRTWCAVVQPLAMQLLD